MESTRFREEVQSSGMTFFRSIAVICDVKMFKRFSLRYETKTSSISCNTFGSEISQIIKTRHACDFMERVISPVTKLGQLRHEFTFSLFDVKSGDLFPNSHVLHEGLNKGGSL